MDVFLIITAVALGGFLKGLNGFGYALVSTSILATFLPPEQAVAIMIIPLITANIELAAELNFQEIKNCLRSFSGLITSLLIGVTTAMLLVDKLPQGLLRKIVGLLAVLYVASNTPFFREFFGKIKNFCFKTWEPAIGLLSGIVYGSSNVALPIVTYLKSRNLGERKFRSMLALTILLVSLYRIGIAVELGMYQSSSSILLSVLVAFPGAVAVFLGRKTTGFIPRKITSNIAHLLIALIGLRLLFP